MFPNGKVTILIILFSSAVLGLADPLAMNLTHVASYAALGDSYASGDGAGSSKLLPNFDPTCGRFSDGYPIQVANSTRLDIDEKQFRNIACGGSSTLSVLQFQSPWVRDSDIVTLTVGGNEVDFFVLLNECVHQWHPFSTCEEEMEKSRRMVESSNFIANYERLIEGTMGYLKPGARLLVTGYATFFNERTEQCSHISFSKTDITNLLTKELRKKFNDLVRLLNDVIKAVTLANGAEYVDINPAFEKHRFCEEGVAEPDPDRIETWFFSLKYDHEVAGNNLEQKPIEGVVFPNPFKDFSDLTSVFHPTGLGHKAIANEIVNKILDICPEMPTTSMA